MAGQFDVHLVTANIGITAGTASVPVLYNPTVNGCIRILSAGIHSGGAGTVTAYLTYNDITGGTVSGTICQLGTADHVYAAAGTSAVRTAATITTAVVPANTTVCVKLAAGTAGSDTTVDLAYVKGQ
jgi:hypothetical protein